MMFCIIFKDDRICGVENRLKCFALPTRKVKFKSTLNMFLITLITDKLF